MKKSLVLLAGYPATGKTYLCNKILEQYPDFIVISQDDMKEALFDQYGFDNMEQKEELEKESWKNYYGAIEDQMKQGAGIISDYPFSDKQKGKLDRLSRQYGYQDITIRLIGDIEVLFQRSQKRDLDPSRHLSHLVSRYHKGDTMEDRTKADCIVTHDIFVDRCLHRGYDKFQLGHLIEADVTDISSIDYDKILGELGSLLS